MSIFAVKTQYFCQVEGHGGCCEEGNQKIANVPSVLAVFEEGQEGSQVHKKMSKTVRFARSKQQEDGMSRWICKMSVSPKLNSSFRKPKRVG